MKRTLSAVLVVLTGATCAWASPSSNEENAAVMYMQSKSFPAIFETCSSAFPAKVNQYKQALDGWLSSNSATISKGEVILVGHAKRDGVSLDDFLAQQTQIMKSEMAALTTAQMQQKCDYALTLARNEQ